MSAHFKLAALVVGGGISCAPDTWQLLQRLHKDSPDVHERVCALLVEDPGPPVEGHLWRLSMFTGTPTGTGGSSQYSEVADLLPAWFVAELQKRT